MLKPKEVNLMERAQEARLRAGVETPKSLQSLEQCHGTEGGTPTKHGKSIPKRQHPDKKGGLLCLHCASLSWGQFCADGLCKEEPYPAAPMVKLLPTEVTRAACQWTQQPLSQDPRTGAM